MILLESYVTRPVITGASRPLAAASRRLHRLYIRRLPSTTLYRRRPPAVADAWCSSCRLTLSTRYRRWHLSPAPDILPKRYSIVTKASMNIACTPVVAVIDTTSVDCRRRHTSAVDNRRRSPTSDLWTLLLYATNAYAQTLTLTNALLY